MIEVESTYHVHVELLKLSPSQRFAEVIALVEALDFDPCTHLRGKSPFSLFDLAFQLAHCLKIFHDIDIVLFVVLLSEVGDDSLVARRSQT